MPCDPPRDLRPRFLRSAFLVASVLASLTIPARVEAGGAVVPLEGDPDPFSLDVRVAVATSPSGTTRWSDVTVPASTRALWLVPARPGATIAWASNGWFTALEEATAPRILPPLQAQAASCGFPTTAERTPPWTVSASKQQAGAFTVHPTADAVRSAANAGGFAIDDALDARIGSLYADGWQLVAVELQPSNGASTSATLRISDDGGSVIPIALSGSRSTETRVTAFSIGAGVMTTNGTIDIDAEALRWGSSGSNFVGWRKNALGFGSGERWLRESASHAALFEGTLVAGSSPARSVTGTYLSGLTCASSAVGAGQSDAIVGQSLPASTFACDGFDDLAIALAGLAPRDAVVTRWSGVVRRGYLGTDRPVTFDANATHSYPARRAGSFVGCEQPSGSSPSEPLTPGPTGGSSGGGAVIGDTDVVYVSDGCGGGTTTTTTYEEDETTTSTSDDGCGGDTSTTTTSTSDEGWDSSDDSDSCASDSSSSSSSDSDSCDSDSSSSSDGCDSGDSDGWDSPDMSPSSRKTSLKASPKRSKSPVSRYALFAVALILPLRRRARAAFDKR